MKFKHCVSFCGLWKIGLCAKIFIVIRRIIDKLHEPLPTAAETIANYDKGGRDVKFISH